MTSVLSRQQLLSGSKIFLYLMLTTLTLQSCGIFGGGKKKPTPPPPIVLEEVDENKDSQDANTIDREPVDVNLPSNPLDTIRTTKPTIIKEQINLAVILPFELDKSDQTGTLSKTAQNSLNLYKGMKFALEEQNYSDKEINVYVFDNQGSVKTTQQILQQQPFPDIDLVVGPLFTKSLNSVASFAKTNKIPFISPLSSSEKLAVNNPYIISANATKRTRYEALLKYLKKDLINPNISVVYQPVNNDLQIKNELLSLAKENKLTIKEQISEGRDMFSVVNNVLVKGRENVVILPTDDNNEGKIYTERMLEYLNTLGSEYNITVAGISEWNGVKDFNAGAYSNINLLILDRYFVNEANISTNSKVNNLEAMNNGVNLHIYTLQGYDLMSYVNHLITIYGKKFSNYLSVPYDGIQTSYEFDQISREGKNLFVSNTSINILKFQNGQWIKVN